MKVLRLGVLVALIAALLLASFADAQAQAGSGGSGGSGGGGGSVIGGSGTAGSGGSGGPGGGGGSVVGGGSTNPACICPAIFRPVCGANGQTYGSDCQAACDNVQVVSQGECGASSGGGGGAVGGGGGGAVVQPVQTFQAPLLAGGAPCTSKDQCNSNGFCHLGFCKCFDGYRGRACESIVCSATAFSIGNFLSQPINISSFAPNVVSSGSGSSSAGGSSGGATAGAGGSGGSGGGGGNVISQRRSLRQAAAQSNIASIFAGQNDIIYVCAGSAHALALTSNGSVLCIGNNDLGQCGPNQAQNGIWTVPFSEPIGMLACGGFHNLAITKTGKLFSWGSNLNGQLGLGGVQNAVDINASFVGAPSQITSSLFDVLSPNKPDIVVHGITAHRLGSWALLSDGSVLGWGFTFSQPSPFNTTGIPVWTLSTGVFHTLAVTMQNKVIGWGSTQFGALGNNVASGQAGSLAEGVATAFFFAQFAQNVSSVDVSAGNEQSHSLDANGNAYAWGLRHRDASQAFDPAPVLVSGIPQMQQVSGRGNHTLYLSVANTVYGQGANFNKQLEDSSNAYLAQPTLLTLGSGAQQGSIRQVDTSEFGSLLLQGNICQATSTGGSSTQ